MNAFKVKVNALRIKVRALRTNIHVSTWRTKIDNINKHKNTGVLGRKVGARRRRIDALERKIGALGRKVSVLVHLEHVHCICLLQDDYNAEQRVYSTLAFWKD